MNKIQAPLTDSIIIAVSQLVNDAQIQTREPSHYDIEIEINRAELQKGDPKNQGRNVGKAKRVRAVLSWAIENNYNGGEKFITYLLATIRGFGGFRKSSPNFVGEEALKNAIDAFRLENYVLSLDGEISSMVLDNMSVIEQEEVLNTYVQRAKKGVEDAALLTGTGKDLLEAVAAHILLRKWGSYPITTNFPTLLGQAFVALGLSTTNDPVIPGEPAQRRVERAMYEMACSINKLRNKQGTGHGRPFISTIAQEEAMLSIESIGVISEFLMSKLKKSI